MTGSGDRVGSGLEYLLVAAAVLVLPRGRRDRWRREWYSALDELHAERLPTLWFAVTALPSMVSIRRATREPRLRRILSLMEDMAEDTGLGLPAVRLTAVSLLLLLASGALLFAGEVFDSPAFIDTAHWMWLPAIVFLLIANELSRSRRRALVTRARKSLATESPSVG
ncbi:hypothetical protein [Nocardia sp. alder85J]|uniref:hypothetical protein n=1 Tax=Nocardia sp. alder85J TaxID=2862949 RepID=UPI001CD35089|nr:hypothetical protein [Nocardia sp. alder85J]MCX4099229.1 hypothetical protein [Nocardia sp. alder85J]